MGSILTNQQGSVFTLLLCSLIPIFSLIILISIEYNSTFVNKIRLQNYTQASALAGAAQLNLTTHAQLTQNASNLFQTNTQNNDIQTIDVTIGIWDANSKSFTPNQSILANAIKVNTSIELTLHQLLNQSLIIRASAIAVKSPYKSSSYLVK